MRHLYRVLSSSGITVLSILLFTVCGNAQQGSSAEQAKQLKTAIEANRPGTIATTANGYTMTATVNGKKWAAGSMMPPQPASRIVGYFQKDYIGLPYDPRDMVKGKKRKLGPNNAADVYVATAPGGWLTRQGEIEVTATSAQWVEGRFSISMKSSEGNGTLMVTDGFFRVPVLAH